MTRSGTGPAPRAAYPLVVAHPVRYGDTDRQGHVNNATFASYFEFSRTEFFYTAEPGLMPAGFEPILARLEIDYLAELFYPGTVDLAIAVERLGTSSVRFAQAVFRGTEAVAAGNTVLVQLETATRRSAPWSAAQRAVLERYALRRG